MYRMRPCVARDILRHKTSILLGGAMDREDYMLIAVAVLTVVYLCAMLSLCGGNGVWIP